MTLVDTATIWASAGALVGGVVVWIAFVVDRGKVRAAVNRGVRNTIVGLEAELDLIRGWATGGRNGLGYPMHGGDLESRAHYRREERDWQNPRRIIHPVEFPTIRGLSTSRFVGHLRDIIPEFVALNFSLVALFRFHGEYREYVLSRPELYDWMQHLNLHPPQPGTELAASLVRVFEQSMSAEEAAALAAERAHELGRFVDQVFEYNWVLHVQRIASAESNDAGCLFVSYHQARAALAKFSQRWKPQRQPTFYFVGHVVATLFALAGVLLMVGWFVLTISTPGDPGTEEIIRRWPWPR